MRHQLYRLSYSYILILIMSLVVASCATTIKVPVTRPAEINLRGINKIMIGEIKGNGGQAISDLITSELFRTGKFEIVDRANLDKIMKEHQLNLSGVVDERTAAEMGKIVGAAVLLTGNVSLYKTEQNNTVGQQWKDKEGEIHQTHYKTATAKVNVTLNVTGLTTGRILASKTISKTAQRQTSADNTWPEDPDADAAMGEASKIAVHDFIKMIAPYAEYVNVTFASRKKSLPELEKGEKFAIAGRWSDAIEQFKLATQKEPTYDGAWWNLGLAYEYSNMFKEAEDSLNEAYKINQKQEYLNEINNVKRLAAERKKLEEQGALESTER